MDFIIDFLKNNFENCIWLAVILVSMCPLLESKIAIPLAMNTAIWGSGAFQPITALLIAFIGNIIPCYAILLISRKMKNKTAGFLTSNFINKYSRKSFEIENKYSNIKKYLALTGFVAVPLPLTGIWSGSLIAGLTNLNINYCLISIIAGAFISASAITLLCNIFSNSTMEILMISIIIIIAFLIIDLIFSFKSKIKKIRSK